MCMKRCAAEWRNLFDDFILYGQLTPQVIRRQAGKTLVDYEQFVCKFCFLCWHFSLQLLEQRSSVLQWLNLIYSVQMNANNYERHDHRLVVFSEGKSSCGSFTSHGSTLPNDKLYKNRWADPFLIIVIYINYFYFMVIHNISNPRLHRKRFSHRILFSFLLLLVGSIRRIASAEFLMKRLSFMRNVNLSVGGDRTSTNESARCAMKWNETNIEMSSPMNLLNNFISGGNFP